MVYARRGALLRIFSSRNPVQRDVPDAGPGAISWGQGRLVSRACAARCIGRAGTPLAWIALLGKKEIGMLHRTFAGPALSAALLALPASTFAQGSVPPGGAPAVGTAPAISSTPGSSIGSVGSPSSGAAPMIGTPPSIFGAPTSPIAPSATGTPPSLFGSSPGSSFGGASTGTTISPAPPSPITPAPNVLGAPSVFGPSPSSSFGGASTGTTISPAAPSPSSPASTTGPRICPIGVTVC
jgi:hypothetical protein